MVDSGSVRPLNPAEVQAAASMSSAQDTDSGTGTGDTLMCGQASRLCSRLQAGQACHPHLWDINLQVQVVAAF